MMRVISHKPIHFCKLPGAGHVLSYFLCNVSCVSITITTKFNGFPTNLWHNYGSLICHMEIKCKNPVDTMLYSAVTMENSVQGKKKKNINVQAWARQKCPSLHEGCTITVGLWELSQDYPIFIWSSPNKCCPQRHGAASLDLQTN